MQRQLKFRVWDKRFKQFITDKNYEKDEIIFAWTPLGILAPPDYANDIIIQQYTGLKDKNGKEIYEGDIMASRGNYTTDEMDENGNFIDIYNVVVWNQKMTRFALKPIDEYLEELKNPPNPELDHPWVCSIDTFKEAVGNVCENPDMLEKLLKKQKEKEKAARKRLDDMTDECPNCFNNSMIDGYCNECGCENR